MGKINYKTQDGEYGSKTVKALLVQVMPHGRAAIMGGDNLKDMKLGLGITFYVTDVVQYEITED